MTAYHNVCTCIASYMKKYFDYNYVAALWTDGTVSSKGYFKGVVENCVMQYTYSSDNETYCIRWKQRTAIYLVGHRQSLAAACYPKISSLANS